VLVIDEGGMLGDAEQLQAIAAGAGVPGHR